MLEKLKYYRRAVKWLWINRDCPDNRSKWRRFDREMNGGRNGN